MGKYVTVIVPCYNEKKRFNSSAFNEFSQKEAFFKFIFVDDGSTDSTAEVLKMLCVGNSEKFEVLILNKNQGKAEAVRLGVLKALESNTEYVGYFDADLATPLEELVRLKEILDTQLSCDIVMGSRIKLLGRRIERKWYRHYLGRIFASAASMVLKVGVYDTQCGAKLFRRGEVIEAIWKDPFMSKWIFDVELIARYQSFKKRLNLGENKKCIFEMPLFEWCDVAGSKVKPQDFIVAIKELFKIYLVYK